MTYRPNPDSLAARVLGFFTLNPDEELTIEDIAMKFVEPGDSRNIHTQLMAACDHDMIEFDPEDDVYRKGPVDMPSAFNRAADDETAALLMQQIGSEPARKPKATEPKEVATCRVSKPAIVPPEIVETRMDKGPAPQAESKTPGRQPATKKDKTVSAQPAFLDLSKVTIEAGIPVPEPGQEWRDFLARFKVGDSAALPAHILKKLRTAIKTAKDSGRGTFTTKTVSDDQVRVWRTA